MKECNCDQANALQSDLARSQHDLSWYQLEHPEALAKLAELRAAAERVLHQWHHPIGEQHMENAMAGLSLALDKGD